MSIERAAFNGRPYYCAVCGLGFDEYMACEEPDCELETDESAEKRLVEKLRDRNKEARERLR